MMIKSEVKTAQDLADLGRAAWDSVVLIAGSPTLLQIEPMIESMYRLEKVHHRINEKLKNRDYVMDEDTMKLVESVFKINYFK